MLTRRSALLAGGLLVSGCSVDSLRAPGSTPAADPDTRLVRRVIAAIRAAREQAQGTPYAAVHDAHLAALGGSTPSPSPTAPASGSAATAPLPQVEAALQQTLLNACLKAHSGHLAMLFASMSAGLAQLAVHA